jgi:adenosylcobinamide amidohydrolase
MPNAVVEFDEDMEFLSSALLNGGSRLSRSVMIMQVPKDHMCSEPKKEVVSRLKALGLPSDTVSFMTAAEVDYVFTESYASYEGAEMAAVVTAGLSNQVVGGDSGELGGEARTIQ